VSSLGRLLCSPLDCRAASPRRLMSAPVSSIASNSTVGSIASDSSFLCVRVCQFLWCEFARSAIVLSAGLQCCEQSAQSLFLLISICCVAGLLSSSESVPIFFPAHARRIPHSQTKASPVFPATSICATKDLAHAPRFTHCEFLVGSSASWSRSFVFLLAL
jgi:hypothetical protein